MYRDTPEFMYPAAARSVLAAMENLVRKEQVVVQGEGLTNEDIEAILAEADEDDIDML
mgnify:CR=1 FL=1